MKLRIKWTHVPNPQIAILHCDRELPKVREYALEDDGEKVHELKNAIEPVIGVEGMRSSGYQLTITKGEVFEWEEVMPGVEKALAYFLGADDFVRLETSYVRASGEWRQAKP